MTKRKQKPVNVEIPFNDLPMLPPANAEIEPVKILRQAVKSSVAISGLKGLVKTLPNPSIFLNAIILKEAQASSEIENVITTQDKLYEALSAKGVEADAATKEVLRYREAALHGFKIIKKKGFLNTNSIIAMQQILEQNKAGIRKLPGTALKNGTTGKTVYTPPDDHQTILGLMKNLEDYLNEQCDLPAVIKLAIQHYQFESIHPFYDGNGRTGRIINVLYLIMHGLLDSPVLYLSAYIIKNKTSYYRLLQEVRIKNNWEDWILFILTGIEETSIETISRINVINNLFKKTMNKIKKELPKSSSKELLEIVFEQPYCKTSYLTERLNISRVSAAKYLKELEGIGILKSKKVWKEVLYINAKLINILKG